jgi:hypothetical protein
VADTEHDVTSRPPDPPAWAESLLRRLLSARDRETISGDLLEEYREAIVPLRGAGRAGIWYVGQVMSFVTPRRLACTLIGWKEESVMARTLSRVSSLWLLAAGLSLALLVGGLIRSNFGPPAGLAFLIPIGATLGVMGLASFRSREDARVLWRAAVIWGGLLAAVLLTRLFVEVVAPVDPLERFLAQARADYSEFDYPRRWIPAAAVAVLLMGAAFSTARKSGRAGWGTVTAMAACLFGTGLYIGLVAIGNTLPLGTQDPTGGTPADLQFFGNVPTMLAPVMLLFSAVLGSIGAMFGRALAVQN